VLTASFSDAPVQLEDGSRATIKQLGQIVTPQPDKIMINLTNEPEVQKKYLLLSCLIFVLLSMHFLDFYETVFAILKNLSTVKVACLLSSLCNL